MKAFQILALMGAFFGANDCLAYSQRACEECPNLAPRRDDFPNNGYAFSVHCDAEIQTNIREGKDCSKVKDEAAKAECLKNNEPYQKCLESIK